MLGSGMAAPTQMKDVTKLTPYVGLSSFIAATGGIVYGYDLVVSGGISIMDDFLEKFYPSVLESEANVKESNYCKYNNQIFQLFTSALYLSALMASFAASKVTKKFGRRASMLVAGAFFFAGTALGSGAQNKGMLISGRSLLGCGLGFSTQAVPLYLSEIAPPRFRGGFNLLLALNTVTGALTASLVNYYVSGVRDGWRISLGIAGVPSLIFMLGSLLLLEDTPPSLIGRGHVDHAKLVLRRIRGSDVNIDAEFYMLQQASGRVHERNGNQKDAEEAMGLDEMAKRSQSPLLRLFIERRYRPQLAVGMAFPFFQQVCGNDAIIFYGPFLFKTAGFGNHSALFASIILPCISLITCVFTSFLVDKYGRRALLLVGSCFMSLAMFVVGTAFAVGLKDDSHRALPKFLGQLEVAMVCIFGVAFSLSWGPLSWLIPSEIFPQEIRSAGQSTAVCVNMLFKFVIAQTFLTMLCALRYGTFVFFGGIVVIMGFFTLLLVPETKGVPLDKVVELWGNHWFWKRFVDVQSRDDQASTPKHGVTTLQL